MGMDPIAEDEAYEVTIQVEGPVKPADFQKFRDELKKFLDKFPGDGTPVNPGIKNTHKKFPLSAQPMMQVREGRGGQRKKV